MIDVSGIKLSLDAGLPRAHEQALVEIARQLGLPGHSIKDAHLLKRSVDARKKANVHFIASYRLELEAKEESRLLERAARGDAKLKGLQIHSARPYEPLDLPRLDAPRCAPVVVGAGPAGLFAAWYLAKCGLMPCLIEQGAPVDERARDVEAFFQTGTLDVHSNIQFGEGGAGTFSDGKLTTNVKNRFTAHVLHWFVEAGAPESILWQAHPHLGSDNLSAIVSSIREDIIARGGEVHFHTKLVGLEFEAGVLARIELEEMKSGKTYQMPCSKLVLACGHSARETFELVRDCGFVMEQKPFSMGVRIEHPQALINKAQWGKAAGHPALGAAEYKLAIHLPSGRSVYSFCMCPGGEVVAAASEAGGIVTNGMSNYARDGVNANAALLVNVDPADFPSDDVLAGMRLQRSVEQRAYRVSAKRGAAPYQAPAQRVGAFLRSERAKVHGSDDRAQGESPGILRSPTYERGVVEAPLDEVLPSFVTEALREALPLMGKKITGFDDPEAILTAPETRSSSPVRICRDDSLQAYRATDADRATGEGRSDGGQGSGLYPCGEGPGFAGGIMSAAIDGLKVAQAVVTAYEARERSACEAHVPDIEAPVAAGMVEAPSRSTLSSFDETACALKAGRAAIFPTDTVFGLGVAVRSTPSPEQLYRLKGRSDQKPIAWLVGGLDALATYGEHVPSWAYELAQEHWPGALTLVVQASEAVPESYRSKTGTIALRMPDHPTTLELIARVGPLATTSANLSGDRAPVLVEEVPEALASQVCVLAGKTITGAASSVIDCTRDEPRILRAGAIAERSFPMRELER